MEVENRLLKDFPEITRIFTRIGTSEIATDPMPPNESDVYIFYKDIKDWSKTKGRPESSRDTLFLPKFFLYFSSLLCVSLR